MQKAFLFLMALTLLAFLSMPVAADDRPALEDCVSIHLRSSEGWWLSVNHDGSGFYGFGTGLARMTVKEGTYNFEDLFTYLEDRFNRKPPRGEEPYMAASYWRENSSAATEYYMAEERQFLTKLFLDARNNTKPPSNAFETRSYEQVESFWERSPWKELNSNEQQ